MPFDQENLGEQQVKGFDEKIRVYAVSLSPGSLMPKPETPLQSRLETPKLPDKPSIAILPFENMSDDPEQEYFSDGITEDIITTLSHFPDLHVIARNSTFTYKGQAVDLRQVGRDLGASYVAEGSVRKTGERVRVTAQLIEAQTGNHVWAERYDRPLVDIFEVQDEISLLIASATNAELRRHLRDHLARRTPTNLAAWELVAKANWHQTRYTPEDNAIGRDLCQRAIAIDPDYSRGFTFLALGHLFDSHFGWSDQLVSESRNAGEIAARRAVELDPNDARARWALAQALLVTHRHDAAMREAELAVHLCPSEVRGHVAKGVVLAYSGAAHSEQAIEHLRYAIRLSPRDHDLAWWYLHMATAEFMRRRYDEAIALARQSAQLNAKLPSHRTLAACLALNGQLDEAREALAELERKLPGITINSVRVRMISAYKHRADCERYLEGLCRAGMAEE
jgi:TolB-like protein